VVRQGGGPAASLPWAIAGRRAAGEGWACRAEPRHWAHQAGHLVEGAGAVFGNFLQGRGGGEKDAARLPDVAQVGVERQHGLGRFQPVEVAGHTAAQDDQGRAGPHEALGHQVEVLLLQASLLGHPGRVHLRKGFRRLLAALLGH